MPTNRTDPRDPLGQNGVPGFVQERQTNPNREVPPHPEIQGTARPTPAAMDPDEIARAGATVDRAREQRPDAPKLDGEQERRKDAPADAGRETHDPAKPDERRQPTDRK